jgi:hypothetical protein
MTTTTMDDSGRRAVHTSSISARPYRRTRLRGKGHKGDWDQDTDHECVVSFGLFSVYCPGLYQVVLFCTLLQYLFLAAESFCFVVLPVFAIRIYCLNQGVTVLGPGSVYSEFFLSLLESCQAHVLIHDRCRVTDYPDLQGCRDLQLPIRTFLSQFLEQIQSTNLHRYQLTARYVIGSQQLMVVWCFTSCDCPRGWSASALQRAGFIM